jgi:capsular exopolysaccharide synthesis family protein
MSTEPPNPNLTSDQTLDDAPDKEEDSQDGGIVERALRQRPGRRNITIWEGTPVQPSAALTYAHDSGSLRSEKLRGLRTELLFRLGNRRGAATFAILGAHPAEGRSQLCAELALAFSQLVGRTLLVDANLRNPKMDKLFLGASADNGLSEVLLGKTNTLPLHRVVGHNLILLTAGSPPASPVDLLSGAQFKRLVTDWSNSYDYVLIDTPPVAQYSDGIVIANAARNIVLVTRRNQTSYAEVTELRRRLDATQTQIVGAVLNDF